MIKSMAFIEAFWTSNDLHFSHEGTTLFKIAKKKLKHCVRITWNSSDECRFRYNTYIIILNFSMSISMSHNKFLRYINI